MFNRRVDGADSGDSPLCSVSVVSGLSTHRYGIFLYVRIFSSFVSMSSSISLLSPSNFGTAANNLSSLSLIFADMEEVLTYRKRPYRCVKRPETTDTEYSSDSSESIPSLASVIVQRANINEREDRLLCKNILFFRFYVFFHIFIITFEFWYSCQ
jgi:hypothetical protein